MLLVHNVLSILSSARSESRNHQISPQLVTYLVSHLTGISRLLTHFLETRSSTMTSNTCKHTITVPDGTNRMGPDNASVAGMHRSELSERSEGVVWVQKEIRTDTYTRNERSAQPGRYLALRRLVEALACVPFWCIRDRTVSIKSTAVGPFVSGSVWGKGHATVKQDSHPLRMPF